MPVPRAARPWALALLVLGVRLAWVGMRGPQVSPDGYSFFAWADDLARAGPSSLAPRVLYTGVVAYAWALRALFGAQAPLAWVIVQSVAVALGSLALYDVARRLHDARTATLAVLAYAFLFDAFQWEAYALSDSIFQAALLATLAAITRAHLDGSCRARAGVAFGLAFLVFWRPVGFLVPACYLAWRLASIARASDRRVRWIAVGGLAVALVALPIIAPFAATMGDLYARTNAQGLVIHDDPQLALPLETRPWSGGGIFGYAFANPLDMLALALARFAAFFAPFLPRYSLEHVAVNAVTLLPVLVSGLWGVRRAWRAGGVERLVVALVLVFPAFHAVTLLDYDLRYRDPVLPLLCLLGSAVLVRWWATFRAHTQPARREI